jgi:hypothetical protein
MIMPDLNTAVLVLVGHRNKRRVRWEGINVDGRHLLASLPVFRRICAWCGKDLGCAPLANGFEGDTHGLCDGCSIERT